jgi:hypothetical protein
MFEYELINFKRTKNMRGFILIAFGILYLIKPNLFQRGIWMKSSVTAKTKTPEEYRKYMRVLAIVLIVIGLILLAYDNKQNLNY